MPAPKIMVDAVVQLTGARGRTARTKVEAGGAIFMRRLSGLHHYIKEEIRRKEQQDLFCRDFFLESPERRDIKQDNGILHYHDSIPTKAVFPDSQYKSAGLDIQLPHLASWTMRPPAYLPTCGNRRAQTTIDKGQLTEEVEALHLLVERGCYVDTALFYHVLKKCMAQKKLILGRRVHDLSVKSGYESNTFLANHIICMYASHGSLGEARQVFTTVAAPDCYMWASIILAHARQGFPTEAIILYRKMRESKVKPDNRVFVAVLKACASAGDLECGKQVHADVLSSAFEPDMFVSTCLVDMYSKCRCIDDARRVFDALPTKNVVTWTAMITGYAQNELGQEALALYGRMQQGDMTPADRVTYVCLLQACAGVGALHQGKHLHAQIQQRGLEADVVVGSCLVDMYAKCGYLHDAQRVFDRLPTKNVVTWSALLNGYAQHSNSQMAMQCFRDMQQQGVKPNDTTFTCLLVACSHEGLVGEGQQLFKMMVDDYGIVPTAHHYNCLVDLLGRSGCLDEAENVLQNMPYYNDVVGWTSLLSACNSHGDIERAGRCFNLLITLEDDSTAAYAYVLMSHMYATAGRWADVDRIESLRKAAGAAKKPARACIEVQNKVHEFTVGEERADVSSKLRSMNLIFKVDGSHVPHTELVLKAVPESQKEDALCGHAEKLALAYGLLNTPDGATLLVTKNLRMCNDCHSSTKSMSRIENREIIVRDAHRVHRFVNGSCSCKDRH